MQTVWALLVGVAAGIVVSSVFTLSFLTGPTVDPLSAYCRGFAEGYSYSFQKNAPSGPIDQAGTDLNEQWCVLETPFAVEGWLWRGPLAP